MKTNQRKLESLFSRAYGVPVKMSRTERIEPWYVVRCYLIESAPELPNSVIVKSLREHPTGFRTDPQQVCTEKVALEFLADLDLDFAPRVLISDLEEGILVLEDLAPRIPLAEILRDDNLERAKHGLAAFARSLAELHASTIGHADDYYAKRRTLGPVDAQVERRRFIGWGWNETRQYVEAIGVSWTDRAEKEMASIVATLDDPGVFLAFSNGDAASNNFLVDASLGQLCFPARMVFRRASTCPT